MKTTHQKWIKQGLIFTPNGEPSWMMSHAWVPTVEHYKEDLHKIYFATRNDQNLSQIGYIVVDIEEPRKILEISGEPVIGLGELGTFDDSAVIPSCIVNQKGKKYFYYIGWMQGRRVPYYASLGLAISDDGGRTYQKFSKGPLLERNDIDPYMTASADVMIENGLWKMWYLTNTRWTLEEDKNPKPRYHIKYAESADGIDWHRKGIVAIDFKSEDEYAIARPCVRKEDGIYKMWYSYRGEHYRIGYAESTDGISWERKDEESGIDVSEHGWDSQMIEYAFIFGHKGKTYMVYNGNEFGQDGIGLAVLED